MKIDFNILWFEDLKEEMDEEIEGLELYLKDHGFSPVFEFKPGVTEEAIAALSNELSINNKYDMILVDLDLGEASVEGSEIARSLRSKIYTDIVFYSGTAVDELRKLLFDAQVDGVRLAHRDTLGDEMELIFDSHINKVCNMHTMRGAILSEVSLVEYQLRDLCAKLLKKNVDGTEEDCRKSLKNAFKGRSSSANSLLKKLDDGNLSPIDAYSDYKVTNIQLIKNRLIGHPQTTKHVEDLLSDEGHLRRIQKLRDSFAHQYSIVNDDGTLSLNGDCRKYNIDEFRSIRQSLLQIRLDLQAAADSLGLTILK